MTEPSTELVRTPIEPGSQSSDEYDRSEPGPYVVAGPVRFGSDPNPSAEFSALAGFGRHPTSRREDGCPGVDSSPVLSALTFQETAEREVGEMT